MKTTTKSAFHRGFTLIELMIVIVILGILMGTILPRLSGAQGRARDTARVSDLNTIGQALELYYDDFGYYPGTLGTGECLDGTESFNDVFSTYFKGSTVPAPPQADVIDFDADGTTECTDSYYYMPLVARGSNNPQAYAVVANVETPAKANYLAPDGDVTVPVGGTFTFNATTDITDVISALGVIDDAGPEILITADADEDTGKATLYILSSGT